STCLLVPGFGPVVVVVSPLLPVAVTVLPPVVAVVVCINSLQLVIDVSESSLGSGDDGRCPVGPMGSSKPGGGRMGTDCSSWPLSTAKSAIAECRRGNSRDRIR